MILSDLEKAVAGGEYGAGIQKCMDILIKFGEAFGVDRMVPLTSAHHAKGTISTVVGNDICRCCDTAALDMERRSARALRLGMKLFIAKSNR